MWAPGDEQIKKALFTHRVLQTSDLSALLNRSEPVVRRRLRQFLIPENWAIRLQRRPTDEAVYALSTEGLKRICEEIGMNQLPYAPVKKDQTERLFLQHGLATNRVVIAFTKACQNHALTLDSCVREWEFADARVHDPFRKFILRAKLEEKGREYSFRPDAMLLLHTSDDFVLSTFVEADRHTESIRRIIDRKIHTYGAFWRAQGWTNFGAKAMRVLFVLDDIESNQRIKTIQRQLQRIANALKDGEAQKEAGFVRCFRITRMDLIRSAKSVVDDPIWWNFRDEQPIPFFNPLAAKRINPPPSSTEG